MKRRRCVKLIFLLLLAAAIGFHLLLLVLWRGSTPAIPMRLWLKDERADVASLLDGSVQFARVTPEERERAVEKFAKSRESLFSRTGISCGKLFKGSENELKRSRDYMKRNAPRRPPKARHSGEAARDCREFRERGGYLTVPESDEEAAFPIAFSILAYVDVQMAERLLRSVYAPQNFYCIHVDAAASEKEEEEEEEGSGGREDLKEALQRIADCLPNVFLAEGAIPVHWGHSSIVRADVICLEQLLRHRWKYFVNLSGRMIPLRTNAELVRILKLFDGANDVDGSSVRASKMILKPRQFVEWSYSDLLGMNIFSLRWKRPPPHNVTIFTGSNQAVLSRAFVVFFLYSQAARDVTDWFSNTLISDEYIWQTLNHNAHLKAPGGYLGDAEKKNSIARLTLWDSDPSELSWSCQGFWKRDICIFGVGDLQWLVRQPQLFANKFHGDFEWMAADCMEELIFNRTVNYLRKKSGRRRLDDAFRDVPFNSSFYRSLPFVSNRSLVIQLKDSALRDYCNWCL